MVPSLVAGMVAAGVVTAGAPAGAALVGDSAVVCVVSDPRAIELSGLVATADGYVAIVDSQWDTARTVIVYLDQECQVTRTQAYPTSPRDPEDLAVAPDGALWVADIGDNITASQRRQTVALWRIPPGGGTPVIHRLTYPDGPHDAEALLIDGQGNPILITKELSPVAYLFRPTRALEPNTAAGVPMELVGEFRPGSAGGLSGVTGVMVTGAAISPDRSRVVVRTYAAAYEWDIPDGDIVGAITQRVPRYTPLGDDVQGEAIAYTVDGQGFLTVDDTTGPAAIRRYEPGQGPPAAEPGLIVEPGQTAGADATATRPATAPAEPIPWYGFALALGGTGILAGFGVWLLVQRRRS